MGVDIYAGPFCRYYAEDWELAVVSATKGSDVIVNVVRPYRIFPTSSDRSVIKTAVLEWRDAINSKIVEADLESEYWKENYNDEYRTEKINEDGINALRIAAAYSLHPSIDWPEKIPDDIDEDFYIKRFSDYQTDDVASRIELAIEFQVWVPINFSGFLSKPLMPNGHGCFIGSVDILCHALNQINLRIWNADEAEIGSWLRRGPLGKGGHIDLATKNFDPAPQPSADGLSYVQHMAQFGFSVFHHLANWARVNRQPMILDC
jgi:hypothetical protein